MRAGYVFWNGLGVAKTTCEYLKIENIEFVPKYLNPANVQKARPIADFWALLKQKVYFNNWKTNSMVKLKNQMVLNQD